MKNRMVRYVLALLVCAPLSLPLVAAPGAGEPDPGSPRAPLLLQEKVDLNRASALELEQKLQGIGKAKAEAIVSYRAENGPFSSIDELLEVKGIGEALLERNRSHMVVQ